jgi:hypothetical protein
MVPEDLASRHGTSFKKECPISSISSPIGLPGVFFYFTKKDRTNGKN